MRRLIACCLTTGVLLSVTPSLGWAGATGRRNTAIAATAVAVGAWSNGTGRAGRRNTALLATAGAAYAWKRYSDKKKSERRRPARRAAVLAYREPVAYHRHGAPGRRVGHRIGHGHHKHHGRGHRHR
jgi:hypothetical protein